jgi:hypothetical protein
LSVSKGSYWFYIIINQSYILLYSYGIYNTVEMEMDFFTVTIIVYSALYNAYNSIIVDHLYHDSTIYSYIYHGNKYSGSN